MKVHVGTYSTFTYYVSHKDTKLFLNLNIGNPLNWMIDTSWFFFISLLLKNILFIDVHFKLTLEGGGDIELKLHIY